MARDKLAHVLIAAATAAVFVRVLDYPFLNWDDQDVFARNNALKASGLIAWAFTTRYMEHYQPLAWLTWGALDRAVGLTPLTAHALNVLLHITCAAFVYVLVRAMLIAGSYTDTRSNRPPGRPEWPAVIATLFWAMHPLRVEVVAWASAMPYALALLFALLSMIAWMRERPWTSVSLFAASLLARPIALGLPVVWLILGPAKAGPHVSRAWRPALAGLGIAIAAALAESSARLTATLAEVGPGARLTLAATAPWRYLWRTFAPIDLTPLDPLALTPRADPVVTVLGLAAIVLLSAVAWRWRRIYPVLAGSWAAYLVLLVPAMGLVPSGLQATADRYTYLAAIPLSVAMAEAAARVASWLFRLKPEATHRLGRATTLVVAIGSVLIATLAVLTWQQALYWRDSVTLWTHAVEIDARNDVALYNLGAALEEAGRPDEALARYEQVLAIIPDHPEATRNRDGLRARGLEHEGNRLAATGNLQGAAAQYAEAVRLDHRRTHAHAALGMALTELGRLPEAQPHLRTAIDQGINDAAVPNALAYVLMQSGDREGAATVLRDAQRRFPNDPNIARNLAMLARR